MASRAIAFLFMAVVGVGLGGTARPEPLTVAVATNFLPTAEELAPIFEAQSSHTVVLVGGATGKLYTQIIQGAPFDVFMAADQDRPARLVAEGRAVAHSLTTYAIGQLVLWHPQISTGSDLAQTLDRLGPSRLAIANPRLAPYGTAAVETLKALDIYETIKKRLVFGQNVGQAFALVGSGNAAMGFVPLAAVVTDPAMAGSYTIVPSPYHAPIRQDAVILDRSRDNPAAQLWMAFLSTESARTLIAEHGYSLEAQR